MIGESSEILQKARNLAKMFEKATDIPCCLIEAKPDVTAINAGAECQFCIRLQKFCANTLNCRETHISAAHEAWRFGGQYIFMCHRNMLHFVAPLLFRGQLVGMILGGPLMVIEPDEYLTEEIEKAYEFSPKQIELLRKDLEAIPVVNTQKARYLSDLLSSLVDNLNNEEGLAWKKGATEQQKEISNMIHQLKFNEPEERYPIQKEWQMLEHIRAGNKQEAQRLLNEILGHIFFASGGTIDVIRARTTELVVLLSRSAMEGGADADKIFGMSFQYLRELTGISTIEQLSFWLSGVLNKFVDAMFAPKTNGISEEVCRAMAYMRQNCTNKISLQETAEYIALSPTYFSRLFKRETGLAFSDYMNTVRVDAAKELLLNPKLSLVDISSFSGFDDQSYFCRVFKRYSGVSPKQYRKCGGNINFLKKGDQYGNFGTDIGVSAAGKGKKRKGAGGAGIGARRQLPRHS